MLRFHTLRRSQWVSRPLDEVFAFFSDARNLEELTPPWLRFRVLTPGVIQVHQGTEIRYRLSLHGIPVYWTTEILRWEPTSLFVDVQRKGPYRLWHHTHRFAAVDGGTLMTDTVRYRLPFGILGRLINTLKVRHDVEKIFDYRQKRVGELFA
jgi:ligand-binding SRPBCC domain-containing protein